MNITPLFVIWACIALAAAGLALYRKYVTRNEDDYIHVAEGEAKAIPQQMEVAQKLDVIDRWERILMIVAVAGGVLLGLAYLYQLWEQSQKPIG
jgi:hypothetical protein